MEPVLEEAINLAFEYDEEEHRKLEDVAIYREVAPKDPGVFWHHSFEALFSGSGTAAAAEKPIENKYAQFLKSFEEHGITIAEEDAVQPIE